MTTIHKQIIDYDWKGRSIWGYAEYRAFENEDGKIQVTFRVNDQATDHFVGCADTMDDARRMIAESHISHIMDYLIYISKRDGTYTKHEWSKEDDETISEDGRWAITRIDDYNYTLSRTEKMSVRAICSTPKGKRKTRPTD